MKAIINVLEKLTGYKPTTKVATESLLGVILMWIAVVMGLFVMYIFE